jgi:lactoylglutathione lyase
MKSAGLASAADQPGLRRGEIEESHLDLSHPGLILFTDRYAACVAFYRDVVGLAVTEEKPGLTVFAFGSAYLMVETGGPAAATRRPRVQNPVVLRFNVPDVDPAAAELRARGVTIEVRAFDWGTIGVFHDPDGNRLELKSPL